MLKNITNKKWVIEIRWPADMEALGLIRETVGNIFRELDLAENDINKIEISIDEACTNVIKHAYRERSGEPPDDIQLVIKIMHDRVMIEVIDYGIGDLYGPHTGFDDIESYDRFPFPDDERPHGLGIHIIRKCMDQVDLAYPADSGTRLTMIKYFNLEPQH